MTPRSNVGPSAKLLAAVEASYRVFGNERIGNRLNVCRCNVCFGDNHVAEQVLVRTPLRQISAVELAEYTNSAHGWDDQMLYFLPRYFELIAQGDHPVHTDDVFTLSRLSNIDWRGTWSTERSGAVESFFDALVCDAASRAPSLLERAGAGGYYERSGLKNVLELIGHAGGDLDRALGQLDGLGGEACDLQLATMVLDFGARLFEDKSRWKQIGGALERKIAEWLIEGPAKDRLEAAFYEASTPEARNTLSLAVSALEGARAFWKVS